MADSLDDILNGIRDLEDAQPKYVTADAYATGSVSEFFASRRLARVLGPAGERYRVNLAKKAITTVTDRLEIAAVTVVGNDTLTAQLQTQVWGANELTLEAPIIIRKSCTYGDGYVFVWPGDEPGTVDIEWNSPLTTRAIYDPEHPRRILYVVKRWFIGHRETARQRVNLYFGDRIEKWVTLSGTKGTDREHWVHWAGEDGEDEGAWYVENPYGMPPVFHFRTDRPYGTPLHADAYGTQDALNKIIVSQMSTLDYQVAPQRYALADPDAAMGEDDTDDFGTVDDPAAGMIDEVKPSAETSTMRSGPGEVWLLRGMKGVGEFTATEPSKFLDPAVFYMRLMATASNLPMNAFDAGGNQPSGESRRRAEKPLSGTVDMLQQSFGATWMSLLSFALRCIGVPGAKVDVRWVPAETTDDLEGWQTVKAKIDAGVPVRQALLEAGYTEEQVEGWLKDSDEQDLKRRVELLAELAKASRDLGTAVGLGVVSAETVGAIFAGLMPAAEDDGDAA